MSWSNLDQTWSTPDKLGQPWLNLVKLWEMCPRLRLEVILSRWVLVGSSRLSSGCLVLRADTSENLRGKNGIMTMMDQLYQQFKIQHHNSAPYHPKMNGVVEAANKNVKKILSKMTETYKDWHEHLPYALCAYQTSVRTFVGATPYSLVYGMEAVLPVEVEIPSLRILL